MVERAPSFLSHRHVAFMSLDSIALDDSPAGKLPLNDTVLLCNMDRIAIAQLTIFLLVLEYTKKEAALAAKPRWDHAPSAAPSHGCVAISRATLEKFS
jgi:hypothetical protein